MPRFRSKSFNPSTNRREKILERDDYTCQYCGAKEWQVRQLDIDHIIPRTHWLCSNEEWNLIVACHSCNMIAGDQYFSSLLKKKNYILQKLGGLPEEERDTCIAIVGANGETCPRPVMEPAPVCSPHDLMLSSGAVLTPHHRAQLDQEMPEGMSSL